MQEAWPPRALRELRATHAEGAQEWQVLTGVVRPKRIADGARRALGRGCWGDAPPTGASGSHTCWLCAFQLAATGAIYLEVCMLEGWMGSLLDH